jgi:hypothetical protein
MTRTQSWSPLATVVDGHQEPLQLTEISPPWVASATVEPLIPVIVAGSETTYVPGATFVLDVKENGSGIEFGTNVVVTKLALTVPTVSLVVMLQPLGTICRC